MDELPRIDPRWTRRRQAPPKDTFRFEIVLFAVVAFLSLAWFVHASRAREAATQAAAEAARVAVAEQRLREADELEARFKRVRYITEAQADREIAVANGGWGVAGPAPVQSDHSRRQQEVEQQAQMRARAEAQLRAEEQRFAALTGQQVGASQPVYYANTSPTAHQRCASAKAQRDEAYRRVDNDRDFEFIRRWNDFVYEACKNT